MPSNVYCASCQGTFTQSTDELAIEIDAPANVTVKIKKIRVLHDDGTATTVSDHYRKVKIVRESVAGTGGSSFTPIKLDANSTASVATVKTGPMTVGTITDTIENQSVGSGTDFYWSARDEDDKIVITPGGIFGIVINTS